MFYFNIMIKYRLWVFCVCLIGGVLPAKGVGVSGSTCQIVPSDHLVYRYPLGEYISHPDALSKDYEIGGASLHFPPSSYQYWLAVPITNVDTVAVRVLMELESTLIDELQFFWEVDGQVEAFPKTGDLFRPDLVGRTDPRFVQELELAGSTSGVLYVMALKPATSMVLKYRLWGERCWLQRSIQHEFIVLLSLGGMVVMLIIGVFFIFYSKDLLFVYYSTYIASAIMLLLLFSGYGLYMVWKDAPQLNNPGYFYGASLLLSIVLYVNKYVSLSKSAALLRPNVVIIVLLLLTMLLSLVHKDIPQAINSRLIILASLLFLSVVVWIPFVVIKRYQVDRDPTYFLVFGAYFFVLISTLLYSVEEMGSEWSRLSVTTRSALFIFLDSILFLFLIGVKFKRQQLYLKTLEKNQFVEQLRAADLLLEGQSMERERIAAELHDNVGTRFSLLKLQAERIVHTATASVSASLHPLLDQIDQIKAIIRKISHDLNPINLDQILLEDAINDLCFDTEHATGIQMHYTPAIPVDTRLLPLAMRKSIYHTIAELINNAIQYATPTRININLVINAQIVQLLVEDDGSGFDSTKITEGLGFQSINARVALYGGYFKIHSGEGGSQFEVQFQR